MGDDEDAILNRELAAESEEAMNAWIKDIQDAINTANETADKEPTTKDQKAEKRRGSVFAKGPNGGVVGNIPEAKMSSDFKTLEQWLGALNLSEYVKKFEAKGYKIEMINDVGLKEKDLEYLGISNPIHRTLLQTSTLEFSEYIHVAITESRQFDSVTVFTIVSRYRFNRSSLCLRYTDFRKFDTILRRDLKSNAETVTVSIPALPGQGLASFRSSKDPIFIAARKQALEMYLVHLSSVLHGTKHMSLLLSFLDLSNRKFGLSS
jgi:hypothetical protein